MTARLSSRAVPRPGAPDLSAPRLALAEFFLGCEEPAECAQWALDWLGAHANVRQALCLVRDIERVQLVAIAGLGLSPAHVSRFVVDLGGSQHPFATALLRGEVHQVSLNGGSVGVSAPFGSRTQLLAVPLANADPRSSDPHGLLLLSPSGPAIRREADWVASLLGPTLGRLVRTHRAMAGRHSLERERALFEGVIQAVPDPVLLTDAEGRIILTNGRAEALFSSVEGESEGRRRAVALNNMLFSAALAGHALDQAEPTRRELLLVDPIDGSDLLFELISTILSDPGRSEQSHGQRIVSVLHNVTDLRAASEELEEHYRRLRFAEADVRAERDRLHLVIDAMADPILVTDPGGAIVLMNDPAEHLFTVAPGAGDEVAARIQANNAHVGSFVASSLVSGDILRYRGAVNLSEPATGRTVPFEAVAGKVLSAHGELIGVVTLFHDQTVALERERLYEQVKRASTELEEKVRQATAELVRQNELLRRQALALEQASALKSQFLANVSHEFRTPLNAILGYTSMLLQGVLGSVSEPQQKGLSRVDSSARHLLSLISDILDITRIEAGKMPIHTVAFGLPELITEVINEVEPIVAHT
ncbi:MAG: histidine kinase dimerization/phospho-acceptor domain-containing protein, partial [Candidatus Rokuibacteriota bacterium]